MEVLKFVLTVIVVIAVLIIGGCIFWGLGSFIIWAFNIDFLWTFWHGLACEFIFIVLKNIFNGGKKNE